MSVAFSPLLFNKFEFEFSTYRATGYVLLPDELFLWQARRLARAIARVSERPRHRQKQF